MRLRVLAYCVLALGLAACASKPVTRPQFSASPRATSANSLRADKGQGSAKTTPAPPTRPPAAPPIGEDEIGAIASPPDFANLPGWAAEDHLAALQAFLASCPVQRRPALAAACARAQSIDAPDDLSARRFFEDNFRPEPASAPGLLTAYFTPVYEARRQPEDAFTAPVRPRPADLPTRATASPYADRKAIESRSADDAIAWMKPEDLFFMQIQGSGVLVFPGGARWRAIYDGANGAPFLGIAAPLREKGLLPDNDTSAQSIRDWLIQNRGPTADAMMDLDRRYVFFRIVPDDGKTPAGAAGARLVPGRDLAVDPSRHVLGEVFWIDASAPSLTGAFATYRRLAVALDTGSAIKGDVRADLYLGEGEAAGLEAGRVRHELRLYRLEPVGPARP